MPQGTRQSGTDLPGLAHACDVLAAGRAVAVPNPPPMTYGLLATSARVLNAVKGRPADQPVAASLHDRNEWHGLVSSLDVPPARLHAVEALLERRLGVLLPLRAETPTPAWVRPAVRAGQVCIFDGRWAPTAIVWERYPRLYGSSANRTGQYPARSAADARSIFGPDCVVIDGDALESRLRPLAASTMVALDRRGRLSLHRSGAHDQVQVTRPNTYIEWLADAVGLPASAHVGRPR